MTSLDRSLRQIENFLKAQPNASVRVRFIGDDTYRNFTSDDVRNEMKCEMPNDDFVFYDHNEPKCETRAKDLRNYNFLEWFKINSLHSSCEMDAKDLTGEFRTDDHAKAEPQTRTPLGVRLAAGDAPSVVWADLSEKQFEQALQTITCLEELNGLANRRRVLQRDCKQWSEAQRSLILMRKFMLENGHG